MASKLKAWLRKTKWAQEMKEVESAIFAKKFKEAHDEWYKIWWDYDTHDNRHPNSASLHKIINQPRFLRVDHILVLGLDDPWYTDDGKRREVGMRETELFFRRLSVIRKLYTVLMPNRSHVSVDIDDPDGKISQGTIKGLHGVRMTVKGRNRSQPALKGFDLATNRTLVYDLRQKQGDLVAYMLRTPARDLPAIVLTDFRSLQARAPSGDAKAQKNAPRRVQENFNLVSAMGVLALEADAKKLTENQISFVKTEMMPMPAKANMAVKESMLTEKAYNDAITKYQAAKKIWVAEGRVTREPRAPETYASEPWLVFLCREDLPRFSRDQPAPSTFPMFLYYTYPQPKLTPSDFEKEGSAGSSR